MTADMNNSTVENLTFGFTQDADLLRQHFLLYEQEFKAIHAPHLSEDEYIRAVHAPRQQADGGSNNEYFFIAHESGRCVGGARISVSPSKQPDILPLEIDGFRLADHFPELKQQQLSYCQMSRFVLMPEFRTDYVKQQMFLHLRRKVAELDIDIVFAYSPKANARLYKQICLAMGLDKVQTHHQIELPAYPFVNGVKVCLQSGVIDKSLNKKILS